ncbi:hypothetical protein ECG_02469 [Echinococcus granulosus]|nr:hypothetical protein ECG_02469 [Echinococcus granulosus]
MDSFKNVSYSVRMKNSSFLRKKHAYPASIVIEVKNEEREKDKMPDYMEESKSQKKVIRQKRKMKADITLNIGIYNLPEDVVRGGTMSRNDSTVLKISEPFYLSEFGHEPRICGLHPCQYPKKKNFNENELESLFKDPNRRKILQAEVSPLLRLVGPILANHLRCPVEALERAGRKKEGFDEILSRLAAILSHKTILCDFFGIPRERSPQSSTQSYSTHPSFPPAPESNLFKLNSDSNTSLHSPELVRPSVLECSFPNANVCEFNYPLHQPPYPSTAEPDFRPC